MRLEKKCYWYDDVIEATQGQKVRELTPEQRRCLCCPEGRPLEGYCNIYVSDKSMYVPDEQA